MTYITPIMTYIHPTVVFGTLTAQFRMHGGVKDPRIVVASFRHPNIPDPHIFVAKLGETIEQIETRTIRVAEQIQARLKQRGLLVPIDYHKDAVRSFSYRRLSLGEEWQDSVVTPGGRPPSFEEFEDIFKAAIEGKFIEHNKRWPEKHVVYCNGGIRFESGVSVNPHPYNPPDIF